MRIEDFDFSLEKEYIPLYPTERRDSSRLFVYKRKDGIIEHKIFRDLPHYLKEGDVLVLNNTRVIPARIEGQDKMGRKVRLLFAEKGEDNKWLCLVKGVKKNKREERIKIGNIEGMIRKSDKFWIGEFEDSIEELINSFGDMPLPPYIKRDTSKIDFERYQTVYAQVPGSIAAPTAGLHFTEDLLRTLEEKGVIIVKITLHIGIGTFLIPRKERVEEHEMEGEFYSIDENVRDIIHMAKEEKRRIIACGTSVVRALETALSNNSQKLRGYTHLFIYPGYEFRVIDGLITNFHLPRSTPLILVASLIGRNELLRCYEEAKQRGYRFLSYGDAMLLI